ncbi:MAG TPA: hypothetical protein VHZ55_28570 [Bryobacteraceae bacterium]|nr:hypothetical protein [Bryobacteraceae bacterium]
MATRKKNIEATNELVPAQQDEGPLAIGIDLGDCIVAVAFSTGMEMS